MKFFPRAGQAGLMLGGQFVGSNTSPTNDFVNIGTIATTPADGQWTTLALTSTIPYRFVKYYSPTTNGGDVAELQFYSGKSLITDGTPFGTPALVSAPLNGPSAAFDGLTSTYYEGGLTGNQYVGLDLAANHLNATPTFSPAPGSYSTPTAVSLATATPGASIYYTTDGSDPAQINGILYTKPFTVSATTTIKAVATLPCAVNSVGAQGIYSFGGNAVVTSMHVGNSLTGNMLDSFVALAASGNTHLTMNYCISAGIPLDTWWTNPPACSQDQAGAVTDIKASLAKVKYDHIVLQPYSFSPCTPYGTGGDGAYVNDFYQLAKKTNPNVQAWVYAQWPGPTAPRESWMPATGSPWAWQGCFVSGSESLGITPTAAMPAWVPPAGDLSATDWVSASYNQLAYHEAVRAYVDSVNPGGKTTLLIPVTQGLIDLKAAFEAGQIPGGGQLPSTTLNAFFTTVFGMSGTDQHLSPQGSYFDGLMFYACLLQKNPIGLPYDSSWGLTQAQETAFQSVAWKTATSYKWCGLPQAQ